MIIGRYICGMQQVVIYDGECGFCSKSVTYARTKVAPELVYLSAQQANLADYGLNKTDCEKALQFVSFDKRVYSAERAVIQILKQGNFGYRFLGNLMSLPIIDLLSRFGYRFIARNRARFPGVNGSCQI